MPSRLLRSSAAAGTAMLGLLLAAAPASSAVSAKAVATTQPSTKKEKVEPSKGGDTPDAAQPISLKMTPEDFSEHVAADKATSLRCPKTWKEKDPQGNVKINLLADKPGPSVNLVVVKLTADVKLEQAKPFVMAGASNTFKDVKFERTDYVKVAGEPALRLIYSGTIQKLRLKFCQVMVLKDRQQYVLTYTAPEVMFDDTLTTAEQVMATLTIK